jgi:hypothetical protein
MYELAILLWVLIAASLPMVHAAGDGGTILEVRGNLECYGFTKDSQQLAYTNGFYASLSNSLFYFKVELSNRVVSECAFDGQVVHYTTFNPDPKLLPGTSPPPGTRPDTNVHSVARIETNAIPHAGGAGFVYLWLAYASDSFLTTNQAMPPVWLTADPHLRSGEFTVPVKCSRNRESGYLETLYFLNDGLYRGWDTQARRPVQWRFPPPYDRGYTNAVFFWNQYTNLGSSAAVTAFSFVQYSSPSDGAEPYVRYLVKGRALASGIVTRTGD